ncbi:MAG: DUF1080 domain-containing protein [Bacteroidetes bacterium]|nr:MAG: DUF1080 domain-containing protein [Bacteroidota bacterium]
MKRFLFSVASFLFFISVISANKNYSDTSTILGKWDITMKIGERSFPSWLEVHRSGTKMLVGEFVGSGGSARPVSRIYFSDGKLSFSIPQQWDLQDSDLKFEATLQGDSLVGTITLPDGRKNNCTAVKAPSLKRTGNPVWGKSTKLFNGTDLKGWHSSGKNNQWITENAILKSPKAGSNLITDAEFIDFKLHVEFRFSSEGNSGVYLRGRYEVQIADFEKESSEKVQLGSIYGFIAPSEIITKPGEWNSYDITLVGRMVTVVLNGKTIICNREIPGITGGALNSREAAPGPIMLQGDHNPIEFRNIVMTPVK